MTADATGRATAESGRVNRRLGGRRPPAKARLPLSHRSLLGEGTTVVVGMETVTRKAQGSRMGPISAAVSAWMVRNGAKTDAFFKAPREQVFRVGVDLRCDADGRHRRHSLDDEPLVWFEDGRNDRVEQAWECAMPSTGTLMRG